MKPPRAGFTMPSDDDWNELDDAASDLLTIGEHSAVSDDELYQAARRFVDLYEQRT
jgi:hypothetical protein